MSTELMTSIYKVNIRFSSAATSSSLGLRRLFGSNDLSFLRNGYCGVCGLLVVALLATMVL